MPKNLNANVMKVGTKVIPKEPIEIKPGRSGLGVGIIKKIEGGAALVEFEIPILPQRCSKCGWPGFLSMHMNTGEVECMKPGCGHGQGFEKVITGVALERLELYTDHSDRKEKEAWKKERERSKEKLDRARDVHGAVLAEGRQKGWIK